MGERKFPQSRKFVMLVGDILIMIGSYCLATAFILKMNCQVKCNVFEK